MNFYLDTEFLEGTQKKRFFGFPYGNTKNTIELISIGIVSEYGREYYAVSKEFNVQEAWNRFQMKETSPAKKYMGFYEEKEYWIRENVLRPIFNDLVKVEYSISNPQRLNFSYEHFKYLINKYGSTNAEIAQGIKSFVGLDFIAVSNFTKPKFYGYYADYDWVVFCWLFGKMIDLPKDFPMYCIDLKQISDELYNAEKQAYIKRNGTAYSFISDISKHPDYPTNNNEHNALSDAKWNRRLHEFLLKNTK